MANNKKIVSMRIDKDLWDISKVMLPCSRREFIEKQLTNYINSTNEIETLENEIKEIKTELQIKEDKLKELKRIRDLNSQNKAKIDKAMDTITRIVLNTGCITKSQIEFISNSNMISKHILEENIKNKNYKII